MEQVFDHCERANELGRAVTVAGLGVARPSHVSVHKLLISVHILPQRFVATTHKYRK
jgi:hypothetical protein